MSIVNDAWCMYILIYKAREKPFRVHRSLEQHRSRTEGLVDQSERYATLIIEVQARTKV
jgi:hypothetical protein